MTNRCHSPLLFIIWLIGMHERAFITLGITVK